jgi:hypothetical protein
MGGPVYPEGTQCTKGRRTGRTRRSNPSKKSHPKCAEPNGLLRTCFPATLVVRVGAQGGASEKGMCPFSNHDARWATTGGRKRSPGTQTSKGEPEAGAGRQVGCAGERRPAARKRAPVSASFVRIAPRRHGWPAETAQRGGSPVQVGKSGRCPAGPCRHFRLGGAGLHRLTRDLG